MNGAILASNLHLFGWLKKAIWFAGQLRCVLKENPVNCLARGVCKKYSRETDGGNGTASSLRIEAGI
jgi:hypothetical protein